MTDHKKTLIIGLGKSGLAAARLLASTGSGDISAWDKKSRADFDEEQISALEKAGVRFMFGGEPETDGFELLVVSPGISPNEAYIADAKRRGAVITGELEVAFEHCPGTFIAITGTNGKTTTTALVGEMFKAEGLDTRVVGNIGLPVADEASSSTDKTYMVTEVSSFQLETTHSFRPHVSAILNITPDHLNRHGTFEEYARVKSMVFMNQTEDDFFVYNADDPETVKVVERCGRANVVPFSRKEILDFGAFVKDDVITIDDGETTVALCKADELKIPGLHNLENALAASAIAYMAGVPTEAITRALTTFAGVEHRIEFVREVNGVRYVNDSKGTNPDASIKAIEATKTPILLIAGGYEKNSDFDEFIRAFDGKVRYLLLLGVTAPRVAESAMRLGFPKENIIFCRSMDMCISEGQRLANPGDTVLLSPASASWGMYNNYEERGDHFKALVRAL